jgi:hypothetical protein
MHLYVASLSELFYDKKNINSNEEIDSLKNKIEELEKNNAVLKRDLKLSRSVFSEKISAFVEDWYEKNEKDVDIGRFSIFGFFKFDVIPDKFEKYLYKRILNILYSLITQNKI